MGFFDELAKSAVDTALGFIPGGPIIKTIAKGIFGTDDEAKVEDIIKNDPEKALQLQVAILNHKADMARVKLDELREDNRAKETEVGQLNDRIKDLEGTAKDLIQAGFFGRVVLWARGAQRPIWGFFTMYMVFMVFSGSWQLGENTQLTSAFWTIVVVVMVFLFGERAVINVLPVAIPWIRGFIGNLKTNGNQDIEK